MINALKVMILEDRDTDQLLIKRQALKYESKSVFTIAKDKATFLEKIDWFLPDLILADYNLPDFTGLDALMYVKENKPFVPFIFVTGGLKPSDPVGNVVLNLADGFVLKDDLKTLHTKIKSLMADMASKRKHHAELHQQDIKKKVEILKALELLKK